MPVQTKGAKAYSDITLRCAADGVRRAAEKTDTTAAETHQLTLLAEVLDSMADVIASREHSYGNKSA